MPENIKEVWSELHSYESVIFGFIKSAVGSSDLARDLCQDVYLSALQNIDQFDQRKSLKNWLVTVARNRVINYFRERKRRQYEELEEDHLFAVPGFDQDYPPVFEAIINLPERQKRAFILREVEGYSYAELSRELKLSESAVTSLLARARENFSKNYLLNHLPDWFVKKSAYLELNDLIRFINAFESPENLLERLHRSSQVYFGSIREKWDDLRSQFFPHHILDEIFMLLGEQAGKISIDLGSGPGFISRSLALNGNKIFSVDINRRMLSVVRSMKIKFGMDQIFPVCLDLKNLSFRKLTFDQAFLALTLHHISNPEQQLLEVSRILKKHGKLVVVEFARHNQKELADKMRDLWLGFNLSTIKAWCKKAGLKELKRKTWNSDSGINVFYQIFEKQ